MDSEAKINGYQSNIPYGMVVWSTGIGSHLVISDVMKQVCQRTGVLYQLMNGCELKELTAYIPFMTVLQLSTALSWNIGTMC
ncbi:hypothetical protein LINPERPRIM_LOCUS2758 [Linum perenne]